MRREGLPLELLKTAVAVVPPLAWREEGVLNRTANDKLIHHIEAGGATVLMYGGNANFYHLAGKLYAEAIEMIAGLAGPATWVIPSIGPAFGELERSADILREHAFPTAMLLPSDVSTSDGVARATSRVANRLQQPVILYVRRPHYIDPATACNLINDGLVSFLKYGHVAADPAADEYLAALAAATGPERLVSGSGEIVATRHFSRFGMLGFTSGSAVIAPALSNALRTALRHGDAQGIKQLVEVFSSFEAQREKTHPILALHEGVELAGIATTGPILPALGRLPSHRRDEVADSARALLRAELKYREERLTSGRPANTCN